MATKTSMNGTSDFMDNLKEFPKKTFDNFVKSTETMQKDFFEKFSNSNKEFFQNWYETQQNFFNPSNKNKKEASSNPMDYFTNWYEQQMEMGRKMMSSNPFFNSLGNNPFENWQKTMENAGNQMMDWNKNMVHAYQEMMGKVLSGEQKDYFKSMFNNFETYTKMYQMWMPLMDTLKEGKFNAEMFADYFKPQMVKEMMDKVFHFMPMGQMNDLYKNWMDQMQSFTKDWQGQSKEIYGQMKEQYENNLSNAMNMPFNQMMNVYQMMQEQFTAASNPFMKMMTPNADKEMLETLQEMNDKMIQFNMKNTQMQFLMYEKGTEAMQGFAQKLADKIQKGENIESFMQFYTEFLNTIDENMVELFGSEHFSKLQAELSSLGFRLKKQMDEQVEKTLVNLPIVTRSEMDSMYKSLYEMNKELRSLLRESANNVTNTAKKATETVKKAAATKATATKKATAKKTATRKK